MTVEVSGFQKARRLIRSRDRSALCHARRQNNIVDSPVDLSIEPKPHTQRGHLFDYPGGAILPAYHGVTGELRHFLSKSVAN
jgi:hypothetical protein